MEEKDAGKKTRRRIIKKEIPLPWRLPLTVLLSLLTGLGLTFANLLIAKQSFPRALGELGSLPRTVTATALLLALAALILGLLTRSLFAGGLAVSALLLTASFVNYFKNFITFSPLQPGDLALIGKLGEITRLNSASLSFSRNSVLAVAGVVIWLGVLFALSRPLRLPWRWSLPAGGAALAAFALLYCVPSVANGWIYEPLRREERGFWTVAGDHEVVLNLWSGVVAADKVLPEAETLLPLPAGEETADPRTAALNLLGDYVDSVDPGGREETPNVIVILAESFFDLTELPGVEYERDPLAEFHRVQEAGVSGRFHTRTFGYGTCAIEMELLTGINTRCFSSDQYLSEWEPEKFDRLGTVPRLFQEKGYYTAFLHTFNDSVYGRTRTYSHLGFDDLYFSDRFGEIVPEAAEAENYWEYMASRISGNAYSDDLMADAIIDLYERERPEHPVFLYAVTMENHTPFGWEKYEEYDYPFTAELSHEAEGALSAVTQAESNCAGALGKLVDYFSGLDEPTLIVFYGDHRPGLGLEEGGSVYSALGLVPEQAQDWTLEQVAELYAADYVIWANDESLLPAAPGTRGRDSSSNFLGVDILRCAGVKLDGWWRLLASVREDVLAWMWSYCISADGTLARTREDALSPEGLQKTQMLTWLVREAFTGDGSGAVDALLSFGRND